jgi:hypothetical protein
MSRSAFRCFAAVVPLALASVGRADDTPLRDVTLSENLADPPALERCMKRIFPHPVVRFVGPVLSADRLRVDYAVVSTNGVRYVWRFRPAIGATWKPFLYDRASGTAVGVKTTSMLPAAEIVPDERWRAATPVDLRPCAAHF